MTRIKEESADESVAEKRRGPIGVLMEKMRQPDRFWSAFEAAVLLYVVVCIAMMFRAVIQIAVMSLVRWLRFG